MIEVDRIVKQYGATTAVDHVSFRVDRGEIVGFLGPNGAGKSTTLKIITGFIVADSGRVTVDGLDILEDSLEVRRRIGYLPENTPIYPDMQVGEFLDFVAKGRQLAPADRRESIERVVAMTGIERMMRKRVAYLSKGYRQRVGIAQALVHDPPILIMDEPTSGLDPHQIIEIRELIRDLGKSKVIVLSSHILQEMSAVSTRILIIRDGRLVADATPQELQETVEDCQVFQCRLHGPAQPIAEGLKKLPSVTKLEAAGPANGYCTYRLFTEKDAAADAVGEDVFQLAAQSGWSLVSFRPEARSLEEVYLERTEEVDLSEEEEVARAARQVPAGRATRLLAQIIDGLVLIPFIIPALLLLFLTSGVVFFVTLGLGSILYLALQWYLLAKDGQTVGKKTLMIRIVNQEDGENPGFLRAVVLRWILNYLVFGSLSGLVYCLVDALFIASAERRCVHDYLAGTKVIELRGVPVRAAPGQTAAHNL